MRLKAAIAQYVAFRKSLGAHFKRAEGTLNAFCRYLGEEINVADVQAEQVQTFLTGTGPITRNWQSKHGALNGLYRYAISRGLVGASPLPATAPSLPERWPPYIYSPDELRRLFNATTAACPKGLCKLEPHTLRTILILLYGAGLRVSEALALSLADVDLAAALLIIRETKFHKTRMVPLGPDLHQVLAQYTATRAAAGHSQSGTAPFFVLRRGGPVQRPLVESRFKGLREYTDVKRIDGAHYQPRLHDLRHSFAVHRLISWYQQGADVQKLLPQLSTYLGHVHLSDTQVYLTMTPELLGEALTRFERYAWSEESHD
jgi:site-specific recombinase XerD